MAKRRRRAGGRPKAGRKRRKRARLSRAEKMELKRLVRSILRPKRGRPGRKAVFTEAQKRMLERIVSREVSACLRRMLRGA